MIIVNLYGAPGAGKSTGAAYLFAQLKMRGINAELVTEVAKDLVWEDNLNALGDQIYVFGKQYHRLYKLRDKVDVVVTDSPLLLSALYCSDMHIKSEFDTLVIKAVEAFHANMVNVFIQRVKPYNPSGRIQTEDESDQKAEEILRFLNQHSVEYEIFNGNESDYDALLLYILKHFDREKGVRYEG